jgi:hypothetical protein
MLVREHINFERGIDPKKAMGIGLRQQIISALENHYTESGSKEYLDHEIVDKGTKIICQVTSYLENSAPEPDVYLWIEINLKTLKVKWDAGSEDTELTIKGDFILDLDTLDETLTDIYIKVRDFYDENYEADEEYGYSKYH